MPTDIEFQELQERVDSLASRLGGMENVASQHGERHADRGEDPIEGELVSGHTHGAGPTPVREATAVSESGAVGSAITLASGAVSGDLLVAIACIKGDTDIGWPAGWTELFGLSSATNARLEAAYRAADGSEGASVSITGRGANAGAYISYRISGARVNQAAPPLEASAGATGSSTTANPDSLTASGGSKNFLWLPIAGIHTGAVSAAPTNYANLLNIESSTGGTEVGVGSADRALNASVEDPGTFTNTSDAWIAATIVVYPDESLLHSGAPDVHHNALVGLLNPAAGSINPDADDRISVDTFFTGLATEDLVVKDAGSAAATEQDWIECTVDGNTGYIRVYAAK